MVFSTGIAPAVMEIAIIAGVSFHAFLISMLIFLVVGWLLAQGVLSEANYSINVT
ncbi:hypothetical protein [Vreelandella aquamarina]|uniref:hypothetical protein n=1 Tax=Vreelandella aquamarina TaxID=77097 RepID=UPI00158002F2|nr:hypothetical protein [Halomonas meridiana]